MAKGSTAMKKTKKSIKLEMLKELQVKLSQLVAETNGVFESFKKENYHENEILCGLEEADWNLKALIKDLER